MKHIASKKTAGAFKSVKSYMGQGASAEILADFDNRTRPVDQNNLASVYWGKVANNKYVSQAMDEVLVGTIIQQFILKRSYDPNIDIGYVGRFQTIAVLHSNPDSNKHYYMFFNTKDEEIRSELAHHNF